MAPLSVKVEQFPEIPAELSKDEISDIIASFGAGARRARAWGFDAVQLHSAHGFLINQFLSPLTNRRTDDYGGSVENSSRFLLDVYRKVRHIVGKIFLYLSNSTLPITWLAVWKLMMRFMPPKNLHYYFYRGVSVAVCGLVCAVTRYLWVLIGARFLQGIFIPSLTTCLAAYLAKTLPVTRLNIAMHKELINPGLGCRRYLTKLAEYNILCPASLFSKLQLGLYSRAYYIPPKFQVTHKPTIRNYIIGADSI